jgi:pimeloyl-ACP methyl ester carboxylesterase
MRTTRPVGVAVMLVLVAVGCGGDDGDGAGGSAAASTTSEAAPATTIPAGGDVDVMVPVGDHALHLVCTGQGTPTVIIEMGAGQTVSNWNGTLPAIAEGGRRTCVYERAGIGESEPGPEPRSAQQMADELAGLIEGAGVAEPIVLVSHSLGGLAAQAFAQQHADLLAGLVFIEPRTAEYEVGYQDLLTEDELAEDQQFTEDAIANEPFGPEIAAFHDSALAVVDAGDLPDLPVIVLSAGVPFEDQPEADRSFWLQTHENLAAQVTNGEQRIVEGAGHEVWRDDQDAVLQAVDDVIAQVG